MVGVIVGFSRYLIIILVACNVLLNFYYFTKRTDRGRLHVVRAEQFLMFTLHFLAYVLLFVAKENRLEVLVFYLVQVAFFSAYMILYPKVYRKSNRQITVSVMFMVMMGLVMQTRLDISRAWKQMVLLLIATGVSLVVPYILSNGRKYLYKGTWIYGLAGLASLAAIMVGGRTEYGAKLSFGFAGFSIQPSEFVKITLVFFVAGMFQRSLSFKRIVTTTVVAAAHVMVLVLSRDLGSALIYCTAYILMLYVATEQFRYVVAGVGCGALASVMAYFLFSHVRVRVQTWQDPWSDITGGGLQIAQSLFGISTGGWYGMGLNNGQPYKVPVAIKDFIFSAICEEMGLLTGMGLLLISLAILIQFFWIATWMRQMFLKIVVFGLSAIYGIQILLNAAGVIKLVPLTGITYPLLSYGGSSLLSTFIIVGIMQGLYILKIREDEEDEREKAEKAAREKAAELARRKANTKWNRW